MKTCSGSKDASSSWIPELYMFFKKIFLWSPSPVSNSPQIMSTSSGSANVKTGLPVQNGLLSSCKIAKCNEMKSESQI